MDDTLGGGNTPHPRPAIGLGAGGDPKVLVATTLAALLLAGSAYVWRRGSGVMNLAHAAASGTASGHKDAVDTTSLCLSQDSPGKSRASTSDLRAAFTGVDNGEEADDLQLGNGRIQDATAGFIGKSSRAKERRRRGKDPMKELLKPGGGKLAKVLKAAEPSTSSRNSSELHRRGSTSRQSEEHPPEDSPKACSSSSSTVVPPSLFPDSLDKGLLSPSFVSYSQPSRSPSKSRSRSRPRTTADHEPSTSSVSKNNACSNSDAASTISSASSSTTTEATTFSSTSTTSSSLTSHASDGHLDADVTPKAEFGQGSLFSGPPLPTPKSPFSRKSQLQPSRDSNNAWNWDSVGITDASTSSSTLPKASKSQRPKPSRLGTLGVEGTSVPYASVVSSKFPVKEPSLNNEHSSEEGDHEEEEQVAPLVFPSLNNPAPDPSSPASSFSAEPPSTSSSLSRPQSRASSSSATSSSNTPFVGNPKSKSNANSSNLAPPYSAAKTGTPPNSGTTRRAPRELGGSGKRPATPGTTSSTSSPLLSASMPAPSSPASQSFPHTGAQGFQGVSAQTQVASLRGALEASRLREQKQKDEAEKITKERDALQWENVAWRRREGELQAQLQQTMHQLQTYAAYVTSMNLGQPHLPPAQILSPPPVLANPSPPTEFDFTDADHGLKVTAETLSSETEESNHEMTGGNIQKAGEAEIDGSGVEGSAVDAHGASSSVPDDSATSSPANGEASAAEGEAPKHKEAHEEAKATDFGLGAQQQHRPGVPPLLKYGPMPYAGGMLSPSHLHSPMGVFPHYSVHATSPIGYGPPMPLSPVPFPFHMPPLPGHLPTQLQQHPFSPSSPFSGSGPQSPVHPGLAMNPFVVNPAAARPPSAGGFSFHRPSTPGGSVLMNGMHGGVPHPPNGNGFMGMGANAGGSGTGSVGSVSPDLTGSPSLMNAFLMQERGRRRGSGSGMSARGSVVKSRGSVLPSDHGIGQRNGARSKTSSGSDGYGSEDPEEEEGMFNELLADAILKRPGSMRLGSSRKESSKGENSPAVLGVASSVSLNGVWNGKVSLRESEDSASSSPHEEEEQKEFTFPSLSDMGSVVLEKRPNGVVRSASPVAALSPSVALVTLQEEKHPDNGITSEVSVQNEDRSPSPSTVSEQ